MRYESKILWTILASALILFLFTYFYLQSVYSDIFPNFLAEFFAGFLGILIGFGLDRQIELKKRKRITKQIINSFLVELHANGVLVENLKMRVKPPKIQSYSPIPHGTPIKVFNLFHLSAWKMFGSRLEIDDYLVLFMMGNLYHDLELFNEAIKNEANTGSLRILLREKPAIMNVIEQRISDLIKIFIEDFDVQPLDWEA